jgi:hypothetical protein
MSLYMLVEKDEDNDLISLWVALGRSTGHYRKNRQSCCRSLARTVRAVWPCTEDTDWCGGFRLRSMPSPSRTRKNSDEEAG